MITIISSAGSSVLTPCVSFLYWNILYDIDGPRHEPAGGRYSDSSSEKKKLQSPWQWRHDDTEKSVLIALFHLFEKKKKID